MVCFAWHKIAVSNTINFEYCILKFKNCYGHNQSESIILYIFSAATPQPTTAPPSAGIPCGGDSSKGGRAIEIATPNSVIKTPNFPNNYPVDATCDYIVRFPVGSKVSLNFLSFNLQHSGRCRWCNIILLICIENWIVPGHKKMQEILEEKLWVRSAKSIGL